jgi:hypothetical protein
MTQPVTNWMQYRKCPICQKACGNPCISQFSRIANGQPVGPSVELEHPHNARRRRSLPSAQARAGRRGRGYSATGAWLDETPR